MSNSHHDQQHHTMRIVRDLARRFAERASEHDRAGSFPLANYDDVRVSGLPALAVPRRFGGWGATLPETLTAMEALAEGDGSTALNVTMHMQTLGHAAETQRWPAPLFEEVCRAAVTRGALINAVASEPELGSPSRGGKPKTTATPLYKGGALAGWLLRGRKTFASMAPALDYMIIPALVLSDSASNSEGNGETVARFLAPLDGEARACVEIVETWDVVGMRSTGSHDVILHDLCVPAGHLLEQDDQSSGQGDGKGGALNAWFMLGVSAVYLGVAQAALHSAARYAQERVPTALGKPIAELESIRRQLGQAEFLLQQARTVLHTTAEQWQKRPGDHPALGARVAVAKVTATNNAVAAVDACLRAVGGGAMSRALPLERYFRDVRAGLFHPINDEAAYQLLGKRALEAANEKAEDG